MLTIDDLLAHECSNPSDTYEGYNVYVLEGHCCSWEIHAKLLGGDGENRPWLFDIIGFKISSTGEIPQNKQKSEA